LIIAVDYVGRLRSIKKVYEVEVRAEQLRRERLGAKFIALHRTKLRSCLPLNLAVAVLLGMLRSGPTTWLSVTLTRTQTIARTKVRTEILHDVLHRPVRLRRLHFLHRELIPRTSPRPEPRPAFRRTRSPCLLEVIGFLSLVSQERAISMYGIVACYLLFVFTNTLAHANLEVDAPGYLDTLFGIILTTST
jgi:hypothetical protein